KDCEMAENDETVALIASLRSQLADRDAKIAEKQAELEQTSISLRAVIGSKNKKIKDLEEENSHLKDEKMNETNATMSNQMQDLNAKMERMQTTMDANTAVEAKMRMLEEEVDRLHGEKLEASDQIQILKEENARAAKLLEEQDGNITFMKRTLEKYGHFFSF
ncbi:hypothetical protein PENTCL1PPCAC_23913, partial [Pristionchus entomophagus]